VAWVSFSPLPGHLLIEDALSHVKSREDFIESLIVRGDRTRAPLQVSTGTIR
jgi:hypothetical protein